MHRTPFACAALLGAIVAAAGVVQGADLPRYKLEVGEVITYESTSTSQVKGRPASQSASTEQLIVTGKDGDGWKLVTLTRDHDTPSAPPTTQPAAAQTVAGEVVELGSGTIYPDGSPQVQQEGSGDPSAFFLKLPATDKDLAGYTAPGRSGGTAHIQMTGQSGADMTFAVHLSAPMFDIYHVQQNLTVTLDTAQGLVTDIEWKSSMDNSGRSSEGTKSTTLKSVEHKDVAWAAKFGSDMDALNAADKSYDEVEEKLSGTEAEMKATLTAAAKSFEAAKAKVTTPEVIAEFADRLKQMGMYEKFTVQTALRTAASMNKPAADWAFDRVGGGDKIALKDLRGKVVLLDFWYKDCPWCIRAMPAIKQIAADYQGKDVAVVGMNVDKNEADAELVIHDLGLNYPSVKTSYAFAKSYGVSAYPTLIVIDQQGIVRKIDTGFSPTLRKDLGDFVDGLLKGNGA